MAEAGSGDGVGYSVNLPLYPYTDDETYLRAFHDVVPPLLKAFAPDVVVAQLGIDTYHSDPLTHLQITTRGYVEAVREVAKLGIPWLALGGGGYDLGAVARAWALAYGCNAGRGMAGQATRGVHTTAWNRYAKGHVSPRYTGPSAVGSPAICGRQCSQNQRASVPGALCGKLDRAWPWRYFIPTPVCQQSSN